jgi:hypothetical protein
MVSTEVQFVQSADLTWPAAFYPTSFLIMNRLKLYELIHQLLFSRSRLQP